MNPITNLKDLIRERRESKGKQRKSRGKQSVGRDQGESRDPSPPPAENTPTTTPRLSFGVELEFLIAARSKRAAEDPDPDAHIPHLPPIFNGLGDVVRRGVQDVLRKNGIPVFEAPWAEYDYRIAESQVGPESRVQDSWEVKRDGTVSERTESTYCWEPVEVTSPAFYAFEEAFDMVKLVVSLLNTNFRCRVNQSCGLHVHVGNGKRPLDFRMFRNFAAIWWAVEPLLAVLHGPERMAGDWSAAGRRAGRSRLATGEGERHAFADAVEEPAYAARYFGRSRKLGEAPMPSALRYMDRKANGKKQLIGSLIVTEDDLGWHSDEEKWADWQAVPFERPKPQRRRFVENKHLMPTRRQEGDRALMDRLKLERGSLARGPPRTSYDLSERGSEDRSSELDAELEGQPEALTMIDPMRTRIDNQTHTFKRITPAILARLPAHSMVNIGLAEANDTSGEPSTSAAAAEGYHLQQNSFWPKRDDTWSGAAELLACDVGSHQVEYLINGGKHGNLRCSHYDKAVLGTVSDSAVAVYMAGGGRYTLEFREARGSLDGTWVAAWARILCRLVEWARDVDAAGLAEVLGKVARTEETQRHWGEVEYDVVDLLVDLGLPVEARLCEERAARGEKAWYECVTVKSNKAHLRKPDEEDKEKEEPSEEEPFE